MIFDFNGVLFEDLHLHRASWEYIVSKYKNRQIDDEEWEDRFVGESSKQIMQHIFANEPEVDIEPLRHEKFEAYKKHFYDRRAELDLADGAIELFEKLKTRNVPFTIATSSWEHSVDLFWDELHLGNWFDRDKVVYADGTFVSKPEPDIYLKAALILHLRPEECVVVEDAKSGVLSAKQAGIGLIIGIGDSGKQTFLKENGAHETIFSLREIDIDKIFSTAEI